MENTERTNGASFLSGFIVGGLIGAGAALLMAPQSGEETRTIIRDKGVELRDRSLELRDDVVDTVEEARSQAGQTIADSRARAAEVVSETSA